MSTTSFSMTFPYPSDTVELAATAINNDDMSPVDESFTAYKNLFINTSSRNNELEWRASNLVKGFKPAGLGYLVEGGENMKYLNKWYAYGLSGSTLLQAIDGLRTLLAEVRRDLDASSDFLAWGSLEEQEITLLDNPPTSLEDAVARNNECISAGGGQNIRGVISFLQGHLSLLEYARDHAMAAVYCVSNW